MDYKKKLPPELRVYREKFDRVFTGRASKAECDELGVPETMRRELWNARYKRRQDAFIRSSTPTHLEERVNADPTEAVIEIIEIRRTNVVKFPLHKGEGPRAPIARQAVLPRVARLSKWK